MNTLNTNTVIKKLRTRALGMGSAVGIALLALTGCASTGSNESQNSRAANSAGQESTAETVTFTDAWVKVAEMGEMSAAFGILENPTDADMTVVSVESSVAPSTEMHETVADSSGQLVMRQVEGGFTIKAHEQLLLEPGSDHLMLMGLTQAIRAGDTVEFTLTFADGSTLEFSAVAKDYAGANENYEGDMDHGDMDHGDMDHGDMTDDDSSEHGGH